MELIVLIIIGVVGFGLFRFIDKKRDEMMMEECEYIALENEHIGIRAIVVIEGMKEVTKKDFVIVGTNEVVKAKTIDCVRLEEQQKQWITLEFDLTGTNIVGVNPADMKLKYKEKVLTKNQKVA